MRKKLRNFIIIFLFCLAIFSVPVLFFVQPKEDFSELEKRYLSELPDFTEQSLGSGEFTEKLGTYVADHFPGREFFVGINAYYDLFSGRQGTKDYFPASDGRLFSRPVEADSQIMNQNLESINSFVRELAKTDAGIPVTLMLVPSSGAVLLNNPDYPDREIISFAYKQAETKCVDLFSAFSSYSNPGSLYYRTDHHWTSEGAFQASCAYRKSLNLTCLTRDEYTKTSYSPFYGSAYSSSGLWLTEPDTLELWYSGNVLQATNETGKINQDVFYPERLEEQDKYRVFLDGNHALVRIENLSRNSEDEHNLLVIRDSFSNSLGCFLADLYNKVILVDLRYYKLPLTDLLLEDIDEILIEYSVDNFIHDTNLAFLSIDPEPLRLKIEEERRPPNYFAQPQQLDDSFFDDTLYLGYSVNGILASYCTNNGKLRNTTISSSAMLSYHETANQIRHRLIYKGNYAILPEVMNDLQPKKLIAALGCNDLATYEMDHCKEMFVAFLDLVREIDPDITIFIQAVMPIRVNMTTFNQSLVDEFNYWLKDNAETYDYCYLDLTRYFKGSDGELDYSYMYNPTHINLSGAPVWYRELLNANNYYHFPEQFYVEYDGATNQPLENGAVKGELPEPQEEIQETKVETNLDRLYTQISNQIPCQEMLELNERTINSYLGLGPEEYKDGRFYLCANNLKADEIWIVELESESSVQNMLEKASKRIEVKTTSYEKYLPEESEISRRGIAISKGNYVALFISPDAEKMKDIFLSFLF